MENNNNFSNDLLSRKNSSFEIYDSALACILFIVFSIAFSVILRFSGINYSGSAFLYFIVQALAEIVFAVAALVLVWTRKKDLVVDTGMKKKINGRMVGFCFLASLVSLLGFGNLTNVFLEILQFFGYSSILGSISINSFWQYLGYIVSSCAIAAFCEELLFRGVIESGFRKFGIKIAIGFSALIFMLMHGNAEQTVHQFIVGVIVGYVFYKTNNLWLGVLIHAFNNFIPITEAYLLSFVDTSDVVVTTTQTIGISTIIIDLIVALAVAWAGYYFISIILRKIISEDEKLNGNNLAKEAVTSITIDGNEENVEMSIDGVVAQADEQYSQTGASKPETPKISGATIAMFIIAGLYLVGEWVLYTFMGFM